MTPPTTLRPDAPGRSRRAVTVAAAAIAVGLAVAVALTFLVGLSESPATVARITFVNPTPYSLDVSVAPGPESASSPVGFVPKQSTAVMEEVPDQGDVWTFRFDGQGESGGEVRLTRGQLQSQGWRVEIPVEVGQRLADAGAPPTP